MFLVVESCCSNICPMASIPQEPDKNPLLKLNIAQKEVPTLKPNGKKGERKRKHRRTLRNSWTVYQDNVMSQNATHQTLLRNFCVSDGSTLCDPKYAFFITCKLLSAYLIHGWTNYIGVTRDHKILFGILFSADRRPQVGRCVRYQRLQCQRCQRQRNVQ